MRNELGTFRRRANRKGSVLTPIVNRGLKVKRSLFLFRTLLGICTLEKAELGYTINTRVEMEVTLNQFCKMCCPYFQKEEHLACNKYASRWYFLYKNSGLGPEAEKEELNYNFCATWSLYNYLLITYWTERGKRTPQQSLFYSGLHFSPLDSTI